TPTGLSSVCITVQRCSERIRGTYPELNWSTISRSRRSKLTSLERAHFLVTMLAYVVFREPVWRSAKKSLSAICPKHLREFTKSICQTRLGVLGIAPLSGGSAI